MADKLGANEPEDYLGKKVKEGFLIVKPVFDAEKAKERKDLDELFSLKDDSNDPIESR